MIRFNKVQINGFSILLTIIQDLTEQKEAEAKIKQAHRDLMSANQEVLLNYLQLEKQQEEIIIHKNQIEAKNRDITASLNYASRIQKTILPPARFVEKTLPEHFIFYQPREIVSGDFYWIRQIDDFIIIAVADCTGHGVPGAFMSMLSATLLNEIVSRNSVLSHPQQANEILNELREQIKTSLRQTGKEGESQDGLDIALCVINPQNHSLQYAGANSPLYLVRDNTLIVYKPDRNPIGIYLKERPFALNQFQYKSNDIIYLCTDGFADQIGGEIERKFLSNRLRRFLLSISQNPMPVQRDLLKQELDNWMYINHETKPPYEQIDDVLLIGVKLQFASAVRSTRRKYNWQSKTILMAEDEEFSYQLLKEAVHNTEVNLIWASNGEEALELYRKNENINLLLLDIQMPIMNGYEVINKIRETNKSIPIIIFTALAALGEKEKGFSSGCDDYIYKPLHVPELLATLNKYLG